MQKIGVFSGGFDSATAEAFQTWQGKPLAYNVDFAEFNADGSNNLGFMFGQWAAMKAANPNWNLLISVPLDLAMNKPGPSTDAAYALMAGGCFRNYPSAVIRIGWEMNGTWYPWSAVGKDAAYVVAFQHVAAIFKKASPSFVICWCPSAGEIDPSAMYPGECVDLIGLDVYMDYRYQPKGRSAIDNFAAMRDGPSGISWLEAFAKTHGKPMAFPEWGVNKDDPYFIEHMAWHFQNVPGYSLASYWDSNSAFEGQISKGQYPNAAAAYKKFWLAEP